MERDRIDVIRYTDEDIQNVADIIGYNTLTEKRMKQVIQNLCFSDAIFDMIDDDIKTAVRYVMEELPTEESNG